MKQKDIITAAIIILLTALVIYTLPLIPNYLREPTSESIVGFQPVFIAIFLAFSAFLIGIPAWIHRVYVNDYSKIKSIWFFALFGGITGALLGEGGNLVMIIPYTILMFIYAYFYKKFTWWKVALTSYLGGILVENAMNRSPIQIPTLMWIAFFTYPYFVTKIWENRKKVHILSIVKDFTTTIIASIILIPLAIYITRNNISPPLIFAAALLPFIVTIIYRSLRKK